VRETWKEGISKQFMFIFKIICSACLTTVNEGKSVVRETQWRTKRRNHAFVGKNIRSYIWDIRFSGFNN